ncbi:MFS transporter [Allobranchiibius huperziae]|uniref:ACS family glucarate transporter-like MFS transporter n=1 Tax=Allobranchiibius huperziae TaxID=1874116 RepID=A0A853DKM2_9MICO|nr:MFS transporter [Allobranchiibius huperziae]NYJ76489.1 ACS family glucarate transporter-like MFS transporter [Allobranchiibius huperziae]
MVAVTRASEAAGPTSVRWWIAGGLILPITFVLSLDRTAMTVSAPIIQRDYGFSLNQMSIVLTAFTAAYALFQVPGGILVRRYGARVVLAIAGLWWSLFTFLTPYGGVFLGFVLVRILLGIGQAADWPASVWTLQRWFPHRERSRANSLLLAGLYLGSFIGSPIVVWVADQWGWQASFHTFALLGAVLSLLWFAVVRDDPRQVRAVNMAEAALAAEVDGDTDGVAHISLGTRAFLTSGQFWAIGLQYGLLLLIQSFFTTWLPTYLVQARGLSFKSMGFVGALPWGAMILAVFGTGLLNDRVFRSWQQRKWLAIAGFLVAAGALAVGALTPNNTIMICWMCVSLGGVGVVQVQVWSGCQDLGGRHAATVTGFTNFCGNATLAFGPIFTSALVSIGGNWGLALVVMASAGVFGTLCWLFVHPERSLDARTT